MMKSKKREKKKKAWKSGVRLGLREKIAAREVSVIGY